MSQLTYLLLVDRLRRLIDSSHAESKKQTIICDQEQLATWLADSHSAITMVLKQLPELVYVTQIPLSNPSALPLSKLTFSSIGQTPLQVWNEYQSLFFSPKGRKKDKWLQYGWHDALLERGKNWKQVEDQWWNQAWQLYLYRQYQSILLGYDKIQKKKEEEKQVSPLDLLYLVSQLKPSYALQIAETEWTDPLRIVLTRLYQVLIENGTNQDVLFDRGRMLRRKQIEHLLNYHNVWNDDQINLLIHQLVLTTQTCKEALEIRQIRENKEMNVQLVKWNNYFTWLQSERNSLRDDELIVYGPQLEHVLWSVLFENKEIEKIPDFIFSTQRWKWIEAFWKMNGRSVPTKTEPLTSLVSTASTTLDSLTGYLETLAEFLTLQTNLS